MMASSSRIMDKPGRQEQTQVVVAAGHHNLHPLKCPRCDSSNTKFCYYNNYSLSQPRHFCKACKRYWTKGGTLRNVPVGGGCRKNKRHKGSSLSSSSPSSANANNNNNTNTNLVVASSQNPGSNHIISSMFYGVHNSNPSSSDLNLQFSNVGNNNNNNTVSGLNLIPPELDHHGSIGLGFSSGILSSNIGDHHHHHHVTANLFNNPARISFDDRNIIDQQLAGIGTTTTSDSQVPNLIGSVKMESLNRYCQTQNQITHQMQNDLSFSDHPNSHYWNNPTTPTTANWHDPTNYGHGSSPSLTSLF